MTPVHISSPITFSGFNNSRYREQILQRLLSSLAIRYEICTTYYHLVRVARLELARIFHRGILSPLCLPFHHTRISQGSFKVMPSTILNSLRVLQCGFHRIISITHKRLNEALIRIGLTTHNHLADISGESANKSNTKVILLYRNSSSARIYIRSTTKLSSHI